VARTMRATTAYGVGTIRAPSTRQRFDPALGTTVVRRGTVPAATLATAATLTVLVGAWGGIVPFVGATMSYSADGSGSWHWDLSHVLLWLIPGALAVVLGLLMLGIVPRVLRGAGRFMPAWAGLLPHCAGRGSSSGRSLGGLSSTPPRCFAPPRRCRSSPTWPDGRWVLGSPSPSWAGAPSVLPCAGGPPWSSGTFPSPL